MVVTQQPSTMIVHQKYPLNAGPALERLRQSFITPGEDFFVRTHGTIPTIDRESYHIFVGGLVERELELPLDQLQYDFPSKTIVATLQCAGSRRNELQTVKPIPGEVQWGGEAISTAVWRGVLLRDVLLWAGIAGGSESGLHVAFVGLDAVEREGKTFGFGGSIPLDVAFSHDVLLAYEMNGELLTPIHGYPLRVVVPGYIGARSVKWLSQIIIQPQPSTNYFQAHAYKLFPPEVEASTVDWKGGEMLGEVPLNSCICLPQDGAVLEAGPVTVQGYAISSGKFAVEGIEVSGDGGATWTQAVIRERHFPWAWCFWEATLHLHSGTQQIIARAWDSLGRCQPEHLSQCWNFKGYHNNAWQRIHVTVRNEFL